MKKALSVLLAFAMIISLIPAVFATDAPTMSTTVDKTEVRAGDTITLTLSIDKTISNLMNFEWAIYFDKTAYTKTSSTIGPAYNSALGSTVVGDNVDILGKNALRVSGLSTLGDPITLNAGVIATVTFTATENITAENAGFEVKTEALNDYDTLGMIEGGVNLSGNIVNVTVPSGAKGYTVSLGGDTQVACGEVVEIPVTIGNNDGKTTYNAYDLKFSFDSSVLKLDMEDSNELGYRVRTLEKTVRITRYGEPAELGEALKLRFIAVGQGPTEVKVTLAYVDVSANALEFNAPAAIVLKDTTTVTVSGYTVTLPDDFTRTDAEGSVIEAGGNLTFVPKDPNYNYTVTVTVGGEEVTPTIGEDGTYTVPNVNGNVVVTSTKSPKSFTVTQGDDTTGAATATYKTDYTFKLTPAAGYTYNMAVTIGGKAYTGFTVQVNDDGTTTYTIPGADVTGDIVINSNKQVKQPATFTVTFDGTGAGDATGESSVKENTAYTFTVDKKDGFKYTISATMGGKAVTVAEGANNTYTITNVTGNLVITVMKESTLTMEVAVSEYVQMDNKTVFLVTVTGTPEEGKAFAYGENVMYKTTAYGENVYSWLVIVDKGEAFDAAAAKANITQASATAEEVAQSYDVNETSLVDINDAQLTYDIYSGKYTDFEKVSVRKFLRADVNSDKIVNSTDAVAVVANSK